MNTCKNSMASSSCKVMTQRELSHINNVVWEIVKRIAPLLEVKEKNDFDNENFYTPLENPSKPISKMAEEQMRLDVSIKRFRTLLDNHGWIVDQLMLHNRRFPKSCWWTPLSANKCISMCVHSFSSLGLQTC